MPYESLPALTVHAYDIGSGAHLTRLPYTSCSWSDGLNSSGSMSASIDYSRTAVRQNLWELLRCWRVILAVQRGDQVMHAGPLTSYGGDAESRRLSLDCGGCLTLLSKRLVLPRGLKDAWRDDAILVDEQHPASGMALTLTGSYPDIIRGLVAETLEWGPLPISLPAAEGGSYTRTYYAWDLATVADRINDITGLENGPEIRFDPRITGNGSLTFDLVADPEPAHHRWNAMVPGSRVILSKLDGDGADMTCQAWAVGGKDDDRTLMCRRTTTIPTDVGCMFLQSKDTEHTAVSELRTLQEHALADLARGAWPVETYTVKIGEEHDVRVGDTADLTVSDDHLGTRTIPLKITDVDGDSSSDWLTIQAQERIDR